MGNQVTIKRNFLENIEFLLDRIFIFLWLLTWTPIIHFFINQSNWNFIVLIGFIINAVSLIYVIVRVYRILFIGAYVNRSFILYVLLSVIFIIQITNFASDLSIGSKVYEGGCTVYAYNSRYGSTSYNLHFYDNRLVSILINKDTYTKLNSNSDEICSSNVKVLYLPNSGIGLGLEILN